MFVSQSFIPLFVLEVVQWVVMYVKALLAYSGVCLPAIKYV